MPSFRVSARLSALALGAGAALSMALACGGAVDSGLFGGPSGAGGSDASGNGNGNGNGNDASTTPASDAGTTTPLPARDAGTRDTGVDSALPPVPVPVPDAGPKDPGIHCGGTACDPATMVCCRTTGFVPGPIDTCMTEKACAQSNGFPIRCDSTSDCANGSGGGGDVCCVTEDPQSGMATDVSCTQKNNCTDQTQTWLCDPAVAGSCPSGETCQPSTTTIPNYSICH